ncbi:MAG: TIGR00730 family Rossman fold protein, partial [Nitrosomonadaceae bacterium]
MSQQDKPASNMTVDYLEKSWSAQESWRVFGIMAEFVEGTERLNSIKPAVSIFGSART